MCLTTNKIECSITDGLQYDDAYPEPSLEEMEEQNNYCDHVISMLLDGKTVKGYRLNDIVHEESEELGAFVDEGQDIVWMHKNGLLTASQSDEVIGKARFLAGVIVG